MLQIEKFLVDGDMIPIKKPDIEKLAGGWEVPAVDFSFENNLTTEKDILLENCLVVKKVFSEEDCDNLIELMNKAPRFQMVNNQGRINTTDQTYGSQRATIWSPVLADMIWQKVKHELPERIMSDLTATDWWQIKKYKSWKPVAISPLLRFMKYERGGQHMPHYDAGYIYDDPIYRTLMSMVIYLTTHKEEGATRFIDDKQGNIPVWERDFSDWTRDCQKEEVLCSVYPERGNVLFFDHRMCHDAEKYEGMDPRIIIRGDVTFKAV